MYLPERFKISENLKIIELVQKYSFVSLVSIDQENNPFISHVPVVAEVEDGQIKKILGHFALRNPHVNLLRVKNRVTLAFQGPHTYITPKWYRSGRDVPTWNYGVVQITGKLKFYSGFAEICNVLQKMTHFYESGPNGWSFELPADLKNPDALTSAIIAFEIIPEKIEAKFKLSQNRSVEDQTGVIEGLATRSDEMSAEIKIMMQENHPDFRR